MTGRFDNEPVEQALWQMVQAAQEKVTTGRAAEAGTEVAATLKSLNRRDLEHIAGRAVIRLAQETDILVRWARP